MHPTKGQYFDFEVGIGEACDGAYADRVIGNYKIFYWPCVVGEVLEPSIVDFVGDYLKFAVLISRVYSFGKLHFASHLAPVLVILFEPVSLITLTQINILEGSPVRSAENLATSRTNFCPV